MNDNNNNFDFSDLLPSFAGGTNKEKEKEDQLRQKVEETVEENTTFGLGDLINAVKEQDESQMFGTSYHKTGNKVIKSNQTIINNTKTGVSDTKPRINDIKPRINDTKPGINDTKPRINDTKPSIDGGINILEERLRQESGQPTLESKVIKQETTVQPIENTFELNKEVETTTPVHEAPLIDFNLQEIMAKNEKNISYDLSDLDYTEEEKELIKEFRNNFDSVERNISKYQYILREKEIVRQRLSDVMVVYNQAERDKKDLNLAIISLKNWYNRYKEDIINNLQENINHMLNGFFGDNHNIRLIQDVSRGKTVVTMEELDAQGNKLGDINKRLSGAQKQLVGFLIQASILNTMKSQFLVLDETFSSFGKEEIAKIPTILENLDNMQLICIEHKDEMFKDFPVKTIQLERDENMKTRIANVEEVPEKGMI